MGKENYPPWILLSFGPTWPWNLVEVPDKFHPPHATPHAPHMGLARHTWIPRNVQRPLRRLVLSNELYTLS